MDPGSRQWSGVRGQRAEEEREEHLIWREVKKKKKNEKRKYSNWLLIAREE